jgi:hypothetical protein
VLEIASRGNPSAQKVSFVIGGVQKGGTNALYSMLSGCPEIRLSFRKEPRFFLDDRFFERDHSDGEITAQYHSHFPELHPDFLAGEGTPAYIWQTRAITRIHSYNPSMRWVICLRNPISRTISHWKMQRRNGMETRPLEQCIMQSLAALADASSPEEIRRADPSGLLTRGLYADQLQNLYHVFGRERVHVVFMSTMRLLPGLVKEQTLQFLKTGANAGVPRLASAGLNGTPPLTDEGLEKLQLFFENDLNVLQDILGEDLGIWRNFPSSL